MSLEQEIAIIVRRLRHERQWTQEDLALHASMSIDTVRKIESGVHLSKLDTLFKLALGLGVDAAIIYQPLWHYWQSHPR